MSHFQTLVDPVKEIKSTFSWTTSGSPASGPLPKTKLATPRGSPASVINWANRKAVREVTSEGLATKVFPKAIAGAIFHVRR